MKETIMVQWVRNVGALKKLLRRLDAEHEHVSEVEWKPGLSGYTVVYRVDPPGYNVGGKRKECTKPEPEGGPPEGSPVQFQELHLQEECTKSEDLVITAEELAPPPGHPMRLKNPG